MSNYTPVHIINLQLIIMDEYIWVFGLNNIGQYSLDTSKQAIIPLKRHSFFNKIGQKVEEFAASEYHTLAHMQNEQVFSFEWSDYGAYSILIYSLQVHHQFCWIIYFDINPKIE